VCMGACLDAVAGEALAKCQAKGEGQKCDAEENALLGVREKSVKTLLRTMGFSESEMYDSDRLMDIVGLTVLVAHDEL
jgi:hypothetical protein